MPFYQLILRNLTRRKTRSLLTILAAGIAVGAMVALVGISEGFEQSFASIFRDRDVDIVVMENKSQRMISRLPLKLRENLAAIPGVKRIGPSLIDMISLESASIIGVVVSGWVPGNYLFDSIEILDGQTLSPGDRRCVLVGSGIAETLGKSVREDLEIEGVPFHIQGIFRASNIFEQNGLIIPLEDMQEMVAAPGTVTGFSLVLEDEAKSAEALHDIVETIERLRGDEGEPLNVIALPTEEYINSTQEIRSANAMAWMTSTISLVIGTIGMLNTMLMLVFERTREIGILRALGWRKSRIMRMVLCESCVLGFLGSIFGMLSAVVLVWFLSQLPELRGLVVGGISYRVLAQGLTIGMLVGVGGGVYPAIMAGRLLPTEAIRHE